MQKQFAEKLKIACHMIRHAFRPHTTISFTYTKWSSQHFQQHRWNSHPTPDPILLHVCKTYMLCHTVNILEPKIPEPNIIAQNLQVLAGELSQFSAARIRILLCGFFSVRPCLSLRLAQMSHQNCAINLTTHCTRQQLLEKSCKFQSSPVATDPEKPCKTN